MRRGLTPTPLTPTYQYNLNQTPQPPSTTTPTPSLENTLVRTVKARWQNPSGRQEAAGDKENDGADETVQQIPMYSIGTYHEGKHGVGG